MTRLRALAATFVLLAVNAALADDPAATPSPQAAAVAPAEKALSYDAFVKEEFRQRSSSNAGEDDSLLRLALDAGVATADDRCLGTVGLGLWYDVDGRHPLDAPNAFDSIHGMVGRPLWLDVYRLNAEYHSDGTLRLVRVGRQDAEHGRPATFDGAAASIASGSPRVRLFAFGGRTAHFFQIDPHLLESWMVSAGAEALVTDELRAEVDYRLIREPVPGPAGTPMVTDHTYGLSFLWRNAGWARARAWLRGVGGSISSVGAAGRAEWLDRQMGVELNLDVQPATLEELNELDNPFFLVLGRSLPHARARLDAWKGYETPAGAFSVHLGGDARQLMGDAETLFNRNFVRAYALGTATDLGGTGLYLSATLEYDRVRLDAPKGSFTAAGSAGWKRPEVRAEVGTYFQSWQYVYYQQPEEVADVRGYYAEARWSVWRSISARARYSYEIFDRRLQTFTVSVSEAF